MIRLPLRSMTFFSTIFKKFNQQKYKKNCGKNVIVYVSYTSVTPLEYILLFVQLRLQVS